MRRLAFGTVAVLMAAAMLLCAYRSSDHHGNVTEPAWFAAASLLALGASAFSAACVISPRRAR